MKESTDVVTIQLDVINTETGEVFPTTGIKTTENRYYSISKITTRINAMDFINTLSEICKSQKDLKIMNQLLDEETSEGEILLLNISRQAKQMNVARSKLNEILKRAESSNLFKKIDTGRYLVNPFIFIGRKIRSNEQREALQMRWEE